jgi:hypothetical protein
MKKIKVKYKIKLGMTAAWYSSCKTSRTERKVPVSQCEMLHFS